MTGLPKEHWSRRGSHGRKENTHKVAGKESSFDDQGQPGGMRITERTYVPPAPLDDPETISELTRLADERNLPDILQLGYGNGSSTLRVTLSPQGMTRHGEHELSGDESAELVADDLNRLRIGKVFGKLRKPRSQRTHIITSEDTGA